MNNRFEYIATFASLILGLAVANVLANYADYVKNRKRVRWYWLHAAWSAFMLIAIASEWWVSLNWASVPGINYFEFLFMLGKPCALFFASALLVPDSDSPSVQVDLRSHYFSVSRPFMTTMLLYLTLDIIDTLLKGMEHFRSLGPSYPIGMAVAAAFILLGIWSKRESVHIVIFSTAFVGLMLGISNALYSL